MVLVEEEMWFLGRWGWLTGVSRVIIVNKKFDVKDDKKLRPFEGSSCCPPVFFLLPIDLA